ncbi:MAG: Crp/Fnr family transcriptional regulator [Cyanobacteria bacterium P01_F01_bin.53]
MKATLDQLAQLHLFSTLGPEACAFLQPHTHLQHYKRKEIILTEGDPLPEKLHILLSGALQVQKNTAAGKETILRSIQPGELFAAPALFGDTHSPTTISAMEDCQVLTIPKSALLDTIQQTPELAIQFLVIFNQRLQQLHNMIHGLVSERAVVRLAQLIHYSALQQGTASTPTGQQLRTKLPYHQIARTIGIAYEECSRLMKDLNAIVKYSRGGKIIILDWEALGAIASGESKLN